MEKHFFAKLRIMIPGGGSEFTQIMSEVSKNVSEVPTVRRRLRISRNIEALLVWPTLECFWAFRFDNFRNIIQESRNLSPVLNFTQKTGRSGETKQNVGIESTCFLCFWRQICSQLLMSVEQESNSRHSQNGNSIKKYETLSKTVWFFWFLIYLKIYLWEFFAALTDGIFGVHVF